MPVPRAEILTHVERAVADSSLWPLAARGGKIPISIGIVLTNNVSMLVPGPLDVCPGLILSVGTAGSTPRIGSTLKPSIATLTKVLQYCPADSAGRCL